MLSVSAAKGLHVFSGNVAAAQNAFQPMIMIQSAVDVHAGHVAEGGLAKKAKICLL